MEEPLTSAQSVLDMVPLTIDEKQIAQFKFYFNHSVRTGMEYDLELYGLVSEVLPNARLEAYRMGCELLLQGLPILVTASRSRYALWLKLRHAGTHVYDFLK